MALQAVQKKMLCETCLELETVKKFLLPVAHEVFFPCVEFHLGCSGEHGNFALLLEPAMEEEGSRCNPTTLNTKEPNINDTVCYGGCVCEHVAPSRFPFTYTNLPSRNYWGRQVWEKMEVSDK